MRKALFCILAAGAFLFASCDKPGGDKPGPGPGPDVPPDVPELDDHVTPATSTLLDLLKEKLEEYKGDATVPTNHIFICAHRANTYDAYLNQIPENSIPNIKKAIELGVDMVELDVRPTSDGQLVLMHDETVNATTDGKASVSSLTLEQIKALKMKARGASSYYIDNGDYVRVPTLEEALTACKGKIFVNLDIKGACAPAGVVRAILNSGTVDQVMIYGVSDTEKKEYIAKGYERCDSWLAVHPYISKPDDIKNYTAGYYDCAKLFQYSTDTYYTPTLDRFGYACHANGGLSYSNCLSYDSQLRTWYTNYYKKNLTGTCNVLEKFIASGSDFIQTDMFEIADAYFKAKGLR